VWGQDRSRGLSNNLSSTHGTEEGKTKSEF